MLECGCTYNESIPLTLTETVSCLTKHISSAYQSSWFSSVFCWHRYDVRRSLPRTQRGSTVNPIGTVTNDFIL